ncbi:DNA translocase FtsK [bacterium]|nr:DNA translocase FtsK [bacterium]
MGRKRKEEKKEYLYLNVASIFLIFLGILIMVASLQPQATFFKDFLRNIFGISAIVFGLEVFFIGMYLNPMVKAKFFSIKLLIGTFLLLFSLIFIEAARANPVFLGKLAKNIFEPLVGNFGIWALFLMFFVLGMYLVFQGKTKFLFKGLELLKNLKSPNLKFFSRSRGDKIGEQEGEDLFDLENVSGSDSSDIDAPLQQNSVDPKEEKYHFVDTVSEPITLIKSGVHSPKIEDSVSSIGNHNGQSTTPSTPVLKATDKSNNETPKLPYSNTIWEYPPLSLLSTPTESKPNTGDTNQRKMVIQDTLKSFGISATVVEVNVGPSVTQYALQVKEGTKTTRILNLHGDLALALASPNGQVRIEAPIPGKSLIGVEVPNITQEFVFLKTMLESPEYRKQREKSNLTICLGKDVSGQEVYYSITKMPHVLIAGATGSGKSIMIHTIITTLLFSNSPDECKFIMVDPKRVELTVYNDIPHLISPVITETSEAVSALKWVVGEMERRLKVLAEFGVRDIGGYNEKSGFQAMSYIVVVLDELADLMMTSGNEVEKHIVRIAQLARATGIHLVLATQRPSTDIITGSIKANIPTRIAFGVATQVDSRVIIDTGGAEKLLGKGDMLFIPPESSKPKRIQGVFTNEQEIPRLVGFLKASEVKPDYDLSIVNTTKANKTGDASWDDESFPKAVEVVVEYGRASASLLQRRLSIGYARAARLLDELEENGVIGPKDGSRPREVLISSIEDIM